MYKIFVEKQVKEQDADMFFEFFTFNEFDTAQDKKKNMLQPKLREYLFKEVLAHDDMI